MTQTLLRAAIGLFALLGASAATHAALVTIDPDDYPLGADLSSPAEGVRLRVLQLNVPSDAPIVAAGAGTGLSPGTGTRVFGHGQAGDPLFQGAGFGGLQVTFEAATDYVAIDYLADDHHDQGLLIAFDAQGRRIGQAVTGPMVAGGHRMLTVTTSSPRIRMVLAGSLADPKQGGLDRLVYEASDMQVHTPEPVSALLLATGAAAMGLRRRRGWGVFYSP